MKFKCDFCGEQSNIIKRIALDEDYDRLTTLNAPRYACPSCSEIKERQRLGSGKLEPKPKICPRAK